MKQLLLALVLIAFEGASAAADDRQTTLLRISGNLDASSPFASGLPAAGSAFDAYATAAQFAAIAEVRDGLLAVHTISIFFYHTAANAWDVVAVVPGSDLGSANPTGELGRVTLSFQSDGSRPPASIPVFPATDIPSTPSWSNGATATLGFTFDPLTALTQASMIGSITDDSRRECAELSTCLDQNLPAVLAACSAGSTSCALPLSDLFLIPADITTRAIAAAGCEGRAFSSKRRCRDCYHRAWRKIRAASSTNLFGGFLRQAQDQVNMRRDQACR